MIKYLALFFVLIWAGPIQASKKYASPNGSANNSGISPDQAWTLDFALGNSSTLVPGDSLVLTDGIFEGNFTSTINGTAEKPIVILAQNEGKAIIDVGKQRTSGTGLIINGSHTWFVGIHVTSSSLVRKSDASNGFATIQYESGISVFGDNNKIINCWIYDVVGGGLELWRSGLNLEVYGSVIFNNGSQDVSRGAGHGMYIQHDQPSQPKLIENNFVFQNASQGINIFTTNPENSGVVVKRNVSFNTGAIATFDPFLFRPPHNLSIGSQNNVSSDMEVTLNLFYSDLQGGRLSTNDVSNVTLGRTYTPNRDISFNDNIAFGGRNVVEFQPLEGLSFQRNKLLNVHGSFFAFLGNSSSFPNATWDSNVYSNVANTTKAFQGLTFQEWKGEYYPFDNISSYSISPAKTREVLITQNKYDPFRFHVSILSFTDSELIELDFSDFAEFKNVDYEIRDMQNPFDPSQKVAGTFGGTSIRFPMNWTKSLQPKGNMPFQPVHTDLTFGTFLLVFERGENMPVVFPEVKDSVALYVNIEGKAFLTPDDFLVNKPAEPFTYVSSEGFEFSCANLGSTPITITSKNLRTGEQRIDQTVVWVFDTIPPYFDAANATYLFDPVVGKITIHLPDFSPTDFHDNCTSWWNITQSRFEVTCADIYQNPEAPVWEFPVVLTSTDPSGNSFSRTVKVIIGNIIESKKVSISSTGPLEEGGTTKLVLGDQLDYTVVGWEPDFKIVSQSGNESTISQPGGYKAKLLLSTGCIVYSENFFIGEYANNYEQGIVLYLDESGNAELSAEDVLINDSSEILSKMTLSQTKFTCEDLGSNDLKVTQTYRYEGSGISNNATFDDWIKVIVKDTIAPVFKEKFTPVDYNFDKSVGELIINPLDFFTTLPQDNCGPEGITIQPSQSKITCADIDSDRYSYTVTFDITVSDASGNSRTFPAAANLRLVESVKVSIESKGVLYEGSTVELRLGNELGYTVLEWRKNPNLIPGQTGKSLIVSEPGFYTAWLMLANGCAVSSQTIEVTESEFPYPPVKEIVELSLDESGKASLKPEDLFGSELPSDQNLDIKLSQSEFTCSDIGEKEITITIKNQAGQTWEEKTLVKVQDNLNPVLIPKNFHADFDVTVGTLTLKPSDFITELTDNCEVKEVTINKTSATCADLGKEIPVAIRAVDASGNVVEAIAILTLNRIETKKISISPAGPIFKSPGQNVELTLGNEFEYSVSGWYKNGELIPDQKEKKLIVSTTGIYFAKLSPKEGCLLESKEVKVEFTEVPFSQIKESITLSLDESGKASLKPENVFVSWPPADPNLDIKLSQTEFVCSDIGEKQITITIKNQAGQTWEEKTIVKVQDNLKPVLIAKNFNADFDVTVGSLALKPADFITELTDNCGVKEVTINKTSATCEDLGKEIPVAIRAVDVSGNVVESVAILTLNRIETKKVILSGASEFCEGEKGQLTLTSEAQFEVIRWRRNGIEIEGQKGKTMEIEQGGKYHAVIRYQGGCLSETNDFVVEVNPLPKGKIEEKGNVLIAPAGFIYQWFRNGELIPGATSRELTVHQMGEYTVELTSEAGCKAKLESVELTISGLGSNWAVAPEELKFYPNPASGIVEVEIISDQSSTTGSIRIYGMDGKDVTSSIKIVTNSLTTFTFDISKIANGTYLVVAEGDKQKVFIGRFVKNE